MPRLVAAGLLFEVLSECLREVNSRLVCQAHQHPQHVGHLVCRVLFFALLEALVAILACHDACQLAHLLGEACHVGQFAEVAHAILLYPLVYELLCLAYCYIVVHIFVRLFCL